MRRRSEDAAGSEFLSGQLSDGQTVGGRLFRLEIGFDTKKWAVNNRVKIQQGPFKYHWNDFVLFQSDQLHFLSCFLLFLIAPGIGPTY